MVHRWTQAFVFLSHSSIPTCCIMFKVLMKDCPHIFTVRTQATKTYNFDDAYYKVANPSLYTNPKQILCLRLQKKVVSLSPRALILSLRQRYTYYRNLLSSWKFQAVSSKTWSDQQFWISFLHFSHNEDICYQNDNALPIGFLLLLALPTAAWAVFPVISCSLPKELDRWKKFMDFSKQK